MRRENFGNNKVMQNSSGKNFSQKTLLDTLKRAIFYKRSDAQNVGKTGKIGALKNLIIICFGTPLIAGDAFGPLVADMLRDELSAPVFVYGTTSRPINGKNMDEWLDFLKTVHKDCTILAIDASLGEKEGSVVVRKDGVCPAAVKGRKKRVGDVGLLGIVAKSGEDPLMSLLDTNFDRVSSLAEDSARLVSEALSF